MLLGVLPEGGFDFFLAGPALHGVVAGEYAFDVTIEDGFSLAEGDAGDGRGGGAADARQGGEGFHVIGEFAAELFDDCLGALV